jgi:hypothetical protein
MSKSNSLFLGAQILMPRYRHAATVAMFQSASEQIFICGGRTTPSAMSASCDAYSDAAVGWQIVPRKLPHQVENHMMVALNSLVYSIGGNREDSCALSDVYSYDGTNAAWANQASLPIGIRGGRYQQHILAYFLQSL